MAKAKILIVEDEHDIVYILRVNLKQEGYEVLHAKTAETGLALARKHKPDLILLDIMLPKMDGLELCRILRSEAQTPILFLTAKKNEIDQVLGFKLGADDYIMKPFSVKALVARIQAVLKRTQPRPMDSDGKISIGGLEVDFDRHEILVNGKHRNLAPREFQLLELLIEANGKVLSRDQLLERIWGYDKSMEISTRTVDQHIARLRRKLRSEKCRIATVKKFGYKLEVSSPHETKTL